MEDAYQGQTGRGQSGGTKPQDDCPPPQPTDDCKGVPPPATPTTPPPKPPEDKDCVPADPCAKWYETQNCDDPCACATRPDNAKALGDGTLRELIDALEAIANDPKDAPEDAVKSLKEDLPKVEDEYAALTKSVTIFEAALPDIECIINSKVRNWYEKINQLCIDGLKCKITKDAIDKSYARGVDEAKKACCDALAKRYEIIYRGDCLSQAKVRENEANGDYQLLKVLADTFNQRIKDLGEIFKQALEAADLQNFKRVCALAKEFNALWATLFQAETWCFRRKDCCICCPKCDLLPNTLPCWTVERYRRVLQDALRAYINARYDRYLWDVKFQTQDADKTRLDEDCKRRSEKRRARFLAEAEEAPDCPAPGTGGSTGGGTGSGSGTGGSGGTGGGNGTGGSDDCGCGKHKQN